MNSKHFAGFAAGSVFCFVSSLLADRILDEKNAQLVASLMLLILGAVLLFFAFWACTQILSRTTKQLVDDRDKALRDQFSSFTEKFESLNSQYSEESSNLQKETEHLNHEVESLVEQLKLQQGELMKVCRDILKTMEEQDQESTAQFERLNKSTLSISEKLSEHKKLSNDMSKAFLQQCSESEKRAQGERNAAMQASSVQYEQLNQAMQDIKDAIEKIGKANCDKTEEAACGVMDEIAASSKVLTSLAEGIQSIVQQQQTTDREIKKVLTDKLKEIRTTVEEMSESVEKHGEVVSNALEKHAAAYETSMERYASVTEKDARIIEKVFGLP